MSRGRWGGEIGVGESTHRHFRELGCRCARRKEYLWMITRSGCPGVASGSGYRTAWGPAMILRVPGGKNK